MSKKENIVEETVVDPTVVLATLTKNENGDYVVIDKDGTVGEPCKLTKDNGIALTPNAANRLWINKDKADKIIAEQGHVDLFYKATKKLGPVSDRIPYAALLKYMDDATKEEYLAIVADAKAAMEADKKKPLTEREKLEQKIARAKAKLAALDAE